MMNNNYEQIISKVICNKSEDLSCAECFNLSNNTICKNYLNCRIMEKTREQLNYVLSPVNKNIFLKACAGSGKTEVVGMKAAYEIKKWNSKNSGIAVLSFTNDATDVIRDRVKQFSGNTGKYPHFIGTLSSFIHSYIVQPFAHTITKYKGKNNDFSIGIIDSEIKVHTGHWMENYSLKIPNNKNSILPIYANQIGFDVSRNDFYFKINNKNYWLNEYIGNFKIKNSFELKNNFINCKKNFYENGFATFDDMNLLAIKILESDIGDIISKRFPFIMIDECQDLSNNELKVIQLLEENGSYLHLIGDLNQSIYAFKNVNPENIKIYVSNFDDEYTLSTNFRSCKEIIDFSNNLINNNYSNNSSKETSLKYPLVYIEYDTPENAIEEYIKLIKFINYENKINRILVKQNSLRQCLEKISCDNSKSDELIYALQLWKNKSSKDMKIALEFAGKIISKWFDGGTSKNNFYCPKNINSVIKWRIYLSNLLNEIENSSLNNFNVTYGEWYKLARKELNSILEKHYYLIKNFDSIENRSFNNIVNGNNFRANSNSSKNKIAPLNNENKKINNIPIITIHASKGCTFDSTLVLSSKTTNSSDGHWKHWFKNTSHDEGERIGYVASTRAKDLLVLGLPKLKNNEKKFFENCGFISSKELIK